MVVEPVSGMPSVCPTHCASQTLPVTGYPFVPVDYNLVRHDMELHWLSYSGYSQ